MALKAQIEAIIYAAEEPVTLEQLALILRDAVLAEPALAEAALEPKALDIEIKSRVRAAVEAGKNVFMEKPAAVDPVGVRSVIESAELAKKKN